MIRQARVWLLAAVVVPALWTVGVPDSTSSNLKVGLTVQAKCGVSVLDLDFGSSTGEQVTAQTSLKVQCTKGTSYDVTLSAGNVFVSPSRNVSDGSNRVPYYLYKDASLTQEWGDSGFGGTYPAGSSVAAVGTGAEQIYTVYGRVPAFSSVPAGTFQDNVTVTVTF